MRFEDVTFSGGFGHVQKGHGIAFGDYDRDGDQDVLAQMGGFYPGDAFANALYRNPGNDNRWLSVRLDRARRRTGRPSGRSSGWPWRSPEGPRDVYAHVGSGGSFGGIEPGAGDGAGPGEPDRVAERKRWPSGLEQVFRGVPLDARLEIVEGESGFRVVAE